MNLKGLKKNGGDILLYKHADGVDYFHDVDAGCRLSSK